nr:hypothetical protein [Paludisphaera soli]
MSSGHEARDGGGPDHGVVAAEEGVHRGRQQPEPQHHEHDDRAQDAVDYLYWEAKQSPWSRWIIAVALPLIWATREAIERLDRFQVTAKLDRNAFAGSYELWGVLQVVSLAIVRLYGPDRPRGQAQEIDSALHDRPRVMS